MNKKEIQAEIERLQNLLEKQEYKLEKVKYGHEYHYIDYDFVIETLMENGSTKSSKCYDNFNYFASKQEAKKYSDHFKLELELLKTRDMIRNGWVPDYSSQDYKYIIYSMDNNIVLTRKRNTKAVLCFQSKKQRDKFMELISIEKIIKYLSF